MTPRRLHFLALTALHGAAFAPTKSRATAPTRPRTTSAPATRPRSSAPATRPRSSTARHATQLEQLAGMTVLSIDTGSLEIIEKYATTGLITDATTNPLFVAQAGTSGDARYVEFVDKAVAYAKANAGGGRWPWSRRSCDAVTLAMDRLAVELGLEIVKLVPGYVSTEVDIRASFDTDESVKRARRIIKMYEAEGVDRSRVLVKLAGTWEGVEAARGISVETSRGGAAALAWIVRGDGSRRRRGHDVDIPRGRGAAAAASWTFRGDAAPPRPRAGYSAGTWRRRGRELDIPRGRGVEVTARRRHQGGGDSGEGGHHVQYNTNLRLRAGRRRGAGGRAAHQPVPGAD